MSQDEGRTWVEAGGGLRLHEGDAVFDDAGAAADASDPHGGWLATSGGLFHRSFGHRPARTAVEVGISEPDTVAFGTFSVTATFTNRGPEALPGGTILLDGRSIAAAPTGCSGVHNVACPLPPLAVGASATLTVTARCTSNATAPGVGVATDIDPVTGTTGPGEARAVLCTSGPGPAILVKTTITPRIMSVGDPFTATTTVRNAGTAAAANVSFSEDVDGGGQVSLTPVATGATCTQSQFDLRFVGCTAPSLAVGAQASVTTTHAALSPNASVSSTSLVNGSPGVPVGSSITGAVIRRVIDLHVALTRSGAATIARLTTSGAAGFVPAARIRITPPSGTAPTVHPPADADCDVTGSSVTCWLPELTGAGDARDFTIASSAVGLRATVDALADERTPADNVALLAAPKPPTPPVAPLPPPSVNLGPSRQRVSATRQFSVRVTCKAAQGAHCHVKLSAQTLRIRLPRRNARVYTVGTERFILAAGASRTVRLRLSTTLNRELRRRSSMRVSLRAQLSLPAGKLVTKSATIVLLRHR